ncbi:PREDICTED: p53 and DNA damage-regulated protein 1-like [Priapulus caudatus]|uniref:p53 and DNA damage-regulated protein 1 n=1 Tax=Priapulus caudatus TaxID=37621 RepID=A0ABM1EQ15_PRICU|nr:PREDICTED: p53 and DNA damage-regulated protein 1-like [Priapulus caudatus]
MPIDDTYLTMEKNMSEVLRHLVEVEEAADDILTDKMQLVNLDRKKNKNREAIRSLKTVPSTSTSTKEQKAWVCFGNMFLKIPLTKAKQVLEEDQEQLDREIDSLRANLKAKVNRLNELEGKEELKGFSLAALDRNEMAAMKQGRPGSS